MSFQFIVNNAEQISIDTKKVVASTTTRDGVVRAISRGVQPWRFEVRLPDGPRWTDYREAVSTIELWDRDYVAPIKFDSAGHDWMFPYLGSYSLSSPFTASWVNGDNKVTITGGGGTSGTYKFKRGDIIQLGTSGKVYRVAVNVTTGNEVFLHRPILDATGSGDLIVGPNCTFNVICTQMPNWTIFARNQVSWSGSFVFVESLV